MTEPDAGTNSFALATRAQRIDSDTYRINGQKVFITGADEAEFMMVVARTTSATGAEELSLFVVDMPNPGVELQPLELLSFAPDRQFIVHFKDVEVPASSRIGPEGSAKTVLFTALNPERYMVSAHLIGLGNLALEKAANYAKTRAPFGTPIGAYQAVQHPLAAAKAHLEGAKLMMYAGCAEYDSGVNNGVRANTTKYLASTAADMAIDAAIQAHGGYAFVIESDIVTLWPKIRLGRVAPINNEMVLNYLGERTLGLPRSY
jgi:alkylation response protein AidB-like acyl-CoA dehydrogenase